MLRTTMMAAAVLGLLAGCAHHANGAEQMENWNRRHPEAASELCTWVSKHPDASAHFFEWEANHPERAHEFVYWTVEHPTEGINVFADTHRAWTDWNWISETHHPAANAFMAWVRRHPEAARELVNHPAGERWAARHFGC